MLNQPTIEKLHAMKLYGMADAFRAHLETPDTSQLGFEERFGMLVDQQWLWKENRALSRRLQSARLKERGVIEDIDYQHPCNLDRKLMRTLSGSEWVRQHQKKKLGRANASINRWLESLHRAFTLGYENKPRLVGEIPKFPMLDESDNVREGLLAHEDYAKLRDELPAHQKPLLVIGYHLGMRSGEILSLRWDQVDWNANLIRLEKRQTTTKQARNAPLYGELRAFLEMAYADPG